MAWWRREEAENPAWPGMVDIFAFSLAIVLILWLAGNWPQRVEHLEKQAQTLSARLSSLDTEKQQLLDMNKSLRDQMGLLAQTNVSLEEKIASLEESAQSLDAQRTSLQEANLGLSAEIQRLSEAHAALRDIGRKDWEELLKLLQGRLAGMPLTIIPNEQDKEIEIHGKPRITFATLQYELTEANKQRLQLLAPILSDLRQKKKFFITISGTADPREVHNAVPPRNNAELSALRAATVAAMLENASPGMGRHLRVMGLGVKGQEKALSPGVDPDEFYQDYRSVSLVLKIDVAAIMQEDQPAKMN
jgi:flagellar motor protein MotB